MRSLSALNLAFPQNSEGLLDRGTYSLMILMHARAMQSSVHMKPPNFPLHSLDGIEGLY